jgi:hypothetical protein
MGDRSFEQWAAGGRRPCGDEATGRAVTGWLTAAITRFRWTARIAAIWHRHGGTASSTVARTTQAPCGMAIAVARAAAFPPREPEKDDGDDAPPTPRAAQK